MVYTAPRTIRGGGVHADILNWLYRYDEDTDRWVRVRRITKSKAEKIRAKHKRDRENILFHSVPTVKVRTDRRTRRRYVIRRDDGLGVWQ